MTDGWLKHYLGQGQTLAGRGGTLRQWERPPGSADPSKYLASDELRAAVNVALALGQPLLLSGLPGTGKTDLAYSLAWELGLDLFVFSTKTTSTARDLFYRYDALRHFHASRFDEKAQADALGFIEAEALGKAILLTRPEGVPAARIDALLPEDLRERPSRQSVVLVDEIDKAPRDFPNDVLLEVERMEFRIHETGDLFTARPECRPILVLTSNSEKNLPEAFLRRCVFHYITPPGKERLIEIVEGRLGKDPGFAAQLDHAIEWYLATRESGGLTRPPSTAECLNWARILHRANIDVKALLPGQREILLASYAALAKTPEDLDKLGKGSPAGTP
ncbi:MAG: MoxR family ATPase [Bryobacterales bacterium]|nr:MoxR family ATPase [Bryobacterales bacterium]